MHCLHGVIPTPPGKSRTNPKPPLRGRKLKFHTVISGIPLGLVMGRSFVKNAFIFTNFATGIVPSFIFLDFVSNDLALNHINHVFGNVRGMVGDAFQVARRGKQVD